MVWLFVLLFTIPTAYVLIKLWIKFVNWLIPSQKERPIEVNPYIERHKMKNKNDKWYREYLDWLDKNGGDIPFDKWRSKEEKNAEKQWKNL